MRVYIWLGKSLLLKCGQVSWEYFCMLGNRHFASFPIWGIQGLTYDGVSIKVFL